jgi:quercetin dioxygenase-like cupin family protein
MDVQPSKPASKGPADWFTGEVWIDSITAGHGPHQLSLGNVRFTAGARTAWHSHSIAHAPGHSMTHLSLTEGDTE